MYCQTRSQLSQTDFEFIAETVGTSTGDREALVRLANDPDVLSELLHDDRLFERTMKKPPILLPISQPLFFYIAIYHAFKYQNIEEDDIVDYVAGICVEFRSRNTLWQFSSQKEEQTIYFVDLFNLMNDLDRMHQYYLRRYIGNVALFLTGFFPDFVFQRSKTEGAPSMTYYENIGSAQFETAASQALHCDEHTAPVLNTLAERFVQIRSALNMFTDQYLNLGKHSIAMIERQAATLEEDNFRRSLEM